MPELGKQIYEKLRNLLTKFLEKVVGVADKYNVCSDMDKNKDKMISLVELIDTKKAHIEANESDWMNMTGWGCFGGVEDYSRWVGREIFRLHPWQSLTIRDCIGYVSNPPDITNTTCYDYTPAGMCNKIDTDNGGLINETELLQHIMKDQTSRKNESKIPQGVEKFYISQTDFDKDGQLNMTECTILLTPITDDDKEKFCKDLDKNQDEKITIKEVIATKEAQFQNVSSDVTRPWDCLGGMDKYKTWLEETIFTRFNKDGDNSTQTYAECISVNDTPELTCV